MTIDLRQIIKAYDVRGITPDQLSPDVARAIGRAFAEVVVLPEFSGTDDAAAAGPKVVIGQDMRDSGPALVAAFAEGLTSAGVDVELIGLCSTDGLYYAAASRGIPGAMFTASHNPAEYNGIKMCRSAARPVGEMTGLAEIRDLAQQYLDSGDMVSGELDGGELDGGELDGGELDGGEFDGGEFDGGELDGASAANEIAASSILSGAAGPHIEADGIITAVDDLPNYATFLRSLVDLSGIRPLKVVVDAGNGMGGLTAPAVLGTAAGLPALPLELIPLYWELDGSFPNHEANPLEPENLVNLQRAVVAHGADIGLAFDGDADRCFVVDEQGQPVPSSVITLLVGLQELERSQTLSPAGSASAPIIVYNLISSRAVPELLEAHGAQTLRTRVGHSFIKQQMADAGAVFGGEHSGHFYFRDFWFADSGMLAALQVLAALGSMDLPLSAMTEMYQPYAQSGEINSRVADVAGVRDKVIAAYQSAYPDAEIDYLDGVTFSNWKNSPRWWFNLRGSNTEPLLRLNVEAEDQDVMEKVRDDVLTLIQSAAEV